MAIEDKLYIYHNISLIAIHTLSSNKFNYQSSHYLEALKTSIAKTDDEIEKTQLKT